jgi:hypothetical protein
MQLLARGAVRRECRPPAGSTTPGSAKTGPFLETVARTRSGTQTGRDGVFSDARNTEVLQRFLGCFERLRAEIRTRHYSIRTEQPYVTWLARFVAFHKCRTPDSLGKEEVRVYPEYLPRRLVPRNRDTSGIGYGASHLLSISCVPWQRYRDCSPGT